MATVEFQSYDGHYICCVGDGVTFDSAWRTYCFADRICFHDQCDDPKFAPHRSKMFSAIQRAICAGLVVVSGDRISLGSELKSRCDAIRGAGAVSEAAAEEIDAFLLARSWRAVSDDKLPG